LGSGDEEEFACMMAIVSMRETCVAYPFLDSDPRTIYNQLVENDIQEMCG